MESMLRLSKMGSKWFLTPLKNHRSIYRLTQSLIVKAARKFPEIKSPSLTCFLRNNHLLLHTTTECIQTKALTCQAMFN